MTTETKSIFCPVVAAEARRMALEKLFRLIPVSRFPRRAAMYDEHRRLAYFAVEGTPESFTILTARVAARVSQSDNRNALLDAMTPLAIAL